MCAKLGDRSGGVAHQEQYLVAIQSFTNHLIGRHVACLVFPLEDTGGLYENDSTHADYAGELGFKRVR